MKANGIATRGLKGEGTAVKGTAGVKVKGSQPRNIRPVPGLCPGPSLYTPKVTISSLVYNTHLHQGHVQRQSPCFPLLPCETQRSTCLLSIFPGCLMEIELPAPHPWKGHLQPPAIPLVTNPGVLGSPTSALSTAPQPLPCPPAQDKPPSHLWPFSSEQPEGFFKILPHSSSILSPPHLKPSQRLPPLPRKKPTRLLEAC